DFRYLYGDSASEAAQFSASAFSVGLAPAADVVIDSRRLRSGQFSTDSAAATISVPVGIEIDIPFDLVFGNEGASGGDQDIVRLQPDPARYVLDFGPPVYGNYIGVGTFNFEKSGGGTFPAGTVFTVRLVYGTALGTGGEIVVTDDFSTSFVSNLSQSFSATIGMNRRIQAGSDQIAWRISHNQGAALSVDVNSGSFGAVWRSLP
ncbi:MAG: hypothetical protein PVF89_07870, partial [Lysobacterales bacterium]